MNILENELECLIYEASKTEKGREQLSERGLGFITSPLIRQLNLDPYGIADLVCVEFTNKYGRCLEFHIIELKKEAINKDTFLQAFGYMVGIGRMIQQASEYDGWAVSFKLHLIGKSIDTSSNFCFLGDWYFSEDFGVHLYTYAADLVSGFMFYEKTGFRPTRESIIGVSNLHQTVINLHDCLVEEFEKECRESIAKYGMPEERQKLTWKLFSSKYNYKVNPYYSYYFEEIHLVSTDVLATPEQNLGELIEKYSEEKTLDSLTL